MCRTIFAILSLVATTPVMTQFNIKIEIASLPEYHPSGSNIYIAGSFNGWNPQNESFKFQRDEKNNYYIDLMLAAGDYEYKITRGGWDKVECKKGGTGIENRRLRVDKDSGMRLDIEEWQDRFSSKPRVSTASKHVRILDTAFVIPQLNRVRRVWIYVPEAADNIHHPVLYMHDGQNVFDEATSFAGEWGVDEFLDSAAVQSCIVVAVDHGGTKRINEYSPYDMERFGKGEGNEYVDFLVNTLKPYVDKNYNTLTDQKNTFIAGSSMGGLISMYALLKYPKIFGGAGIFSPAFWVAPKIFDDIRAHGKKVKANIFFYAGKQEGESMVPDMQKAYEAMKAVSKSKIKIVVHEEGKHNEPTWRKLFLCGYMWMLQPGSPTTIVGSHGIKIGFKPVTCYD